MKGLLSVCHFPHQCGSTAKLDAKQSIEYAFTVPHDMQTLIQFMGGASEFERRLDYIFMPNTSEQNLGANGGGIDTLMNIGSVCPIIDVKRAWAKYTPAATSQISRRHMSITILTNRQRVSSDLDPLEINSKLELPLELCVQTRADFLPDSFHDAAYGVPGNSDAGALNSWLLWQMLGLYPVVTQPVYLLSSPWFSDINMTINGNATLRIRANNLDNENSYYVQSVKINGKSWMQNWFSHEDVMINGGTIDFQMGSEMKFWETGPVPPSPGHYLKDKAAKIRPVLV